MLIIDSAKHELSAIQQKHPKLASFCQSVEKNVFSMVTTGPAKIVLPPVVMKNYLNFDVSVHISTAVFAI